MYVFNIFQFRLGLYYLVIITLSPLNHSTRISVLATTPIPPTHRHTVNATAIHRDWLATHVILESAASAMHY